MLSVGLAIENGGIPDARPYGVWPNEYGNDDISFATSTGLEFGVDLVEELLRLDVLTKGGGCCCCCCCC